MLEEQLGHRWIAKKDTASPTVSLQSLFITWTIDAMEGRDVMVSDILNAFVQADMPQDINGSDRTNNEDNWRNGKSIG